MLFNLLMLLKKPWEKHMLLKKYVFPTCEGTHINLICGLYKILYKLIYRKFQSLIVAEPEMTLVGGDIKIIKLYFYFHRLYFNTIYINMINII
jgi:hypothetical protein